MMAMLITQVLASLNQLVTGTARVRRSSMAARISEEDVLGDQILGAVVAEGLDSLVNIHKEM